MKEMITRMSRNSVLVVFLLINSVFCSDRFGKNLGHLAETLGDLFGAADDCQFTCPNGETPRINKFHKKTTNGCGSYGVTFKMDNIPGMTECCNQHDLCYDTCNMDKVTCDRQLKTCLQGLCQQLEKRSAVKDRTAAAECRTLVQYLYGGVSAMGCEAYITSQKETCTCPGHTGQGEGNRAHKRVHFDDWF